MGFWKKALIATGIVAGGAVVGAKNPEKVNNILNGAKDYAGKAVDAVKGVFSKEGGSK